MSNSKCKNSSLYLWDLIEGTSEAINGISKYRHLSIIFRDCSFITNFICRNRAKFFNFKVCKKCFKRQFIRRNNSILAFNCSEIYLEIIKLHLIIHEINKLATLKRMKKKRKMKKRRKITKNRRMKLMKGKSIMIF